MTMQTEVDRKREKFIASQSYTAAFEYTAVLRRTYKNQGKATEAKAIFGLIGLALKAQRLKIL